ncbi:hypothetical protein BKA82DRAFT_4016047 [Pisolithus tinctorius]|nr:hypothetical protein BKA82DRAFT_4016047 [Pisolithus tinctorius]
MVCQMQNDYICEWVLWKGEFLKILLELEASPEPRNCTWCGNNEVHRCPDCLHQPLFCTECCWKSHESLPFHRIQQWTGEFYEESALHMVRDQLVAQNYIHIETHRLVFSCTWDMVEHPVPMQSHKPSKQQVNLHPWMVKSGKMWKILKKTQSTSILQWGQDISPLWMSQVAQKWQYLKLLKWNGFCGTTRSAEKGRLALFCAACPQPGINVDTNEDLDHWQFTCTVVMDGNFKVEYMHEQKSKDQVWLMDRLGYMATPHIVEAQKSTCNNHRAITQANAAQGTLHVTGIGATACTQYGCFYLHCVVDFQIGERQLNMDSSLANALGYNMEGIKQVVCFYDINCSYMTNLQKHIIPGISIWYVHGHKKECYAWYALLFIKGARWVDGEIIETLWSVLNMASTSAHWMTSPHCQELLDFQMNDSNFMKMIQIDSLLWNLKAAQAAVPLARQAYIKLDDILSAEQ